MRRKRPDGASRRATTSDGHCPRAWVIVDVESGLDGGLFETLRLMVELHTVIASGIFVVVFLEILQKRSLPPPRGEEALGCSFSGL